MYSHLLLLGLRGAARTLLHRGLRLAPLTAVMQYLIDRGAFTPEHVAYQMIERLRSGIERHHERFGS